MSDQQQTDHRVANPQAVLIALLFVVSLFWAGLTRFVCSRYDIPLTSGQLLVVLIVIFAFLVMVTSRIRRF